jgi:hypothetical protein
VKVGVLAVLLCALASPAWAKSTRVMAHAYDRVWPASLRFLRVDEHLKITEKDSDAGYVLFELVDGKKTFQGALELVRTKDSKERDVTRVVMTLSDRPAYMEEGFLDRLEQKLRGELGDPPAPKPTP